MNLLRLQPRSDSCREYLDLTHWTPVTWSPGWSLSPFSLQTRLHPLRSKGQSLTHALTMLIRSIANQRLLFLQVLLSLLGHFPYNLRLVSVLYRGANTLYEERRGH